MSLSICCMTNDPGPQVAALLGQLRNAADEIVVAVDSRVSELADFAAVADTLLRYEYAPPQERAVTWLHQQCRGDWVLRIDGDEVLSQGLIDALPELTRARDVLQYWIPRRWLFPEAGRWLDELPWWPDYQPRLNRNDPATLWFPGLLHSSTAAVQPARYLEQPMYHLVTLLLSPEQRAEKAGDYESVRPGLRAPGGFPTNSFYLPEHYARQPPAAVPAADLALINAVLKPPAPRAGGPSPSQVPLATREVIDASWPARLETEGVTSPAFYRAEISLVESDLRMAAGVPRPVSVRVANTSDTDWPGGIADRPRIVLGARWLVDEESSIVLSESARQGFTANVPAGTSTIVPLTVAPPSSPGSYVLVFDLLHEYSRWFGCELRVPVVVQPEEPALEFPAPALVAVVYIDRLADAFTPTLRSLRASHPNLDVIVGGPNPAGLASLAEPGVEVVEAQSLAALINAAYARHGSHVFAVGDAVTLPPNTLSAALEVVADDLRVATVSFLSNAAGFLSFPFRNTPVSHQIESLDEVAITRMLRTSVPRSGPAAVPWATGGAVLISAHAMSAVGPLHEVPDNHLELTFADFSLRGRRRGFVDVLDTVTFIARPWDLAPSRPAETTIEGAHWNWLLERHPYIDGLLEEDTSDEASPLTVSLESARCKVMGLRVLVDGTCLGPKEMGTQVQVVALVEALAAQSDIASIGVVLPGDVPAYAVKAFSDPKVNARYSPGGDLAPFGPADIMHRPFQPNAPVPILEWRKFASRTVVTLLDLIAYQIGAYHGPDHPWLDYRRNLRRAVAEADGVVVIAHDVERQLVMERLPVDPDRLYVAELGTDHMTGEEVASIPAELQARGFIAGEFALVLGANYSHKNRDLAIAAFAELRRRGLHLSLVCVGAMVPYGSSRIYEAQMDQPYASDTFIIPDVTSAERNWLFRHASVVLYPTSAEGFGLVPYEAARFGTPTVLVPFGPLRETAGNLPVGAANWTPGALADAAEQLLRDPALARKQVAAALEAGTDYTWTRAAEKLVAVYRDLVSRPPR